MVDGIALEQVYEGWIPAMPLSSCMRLCKLLALSGLQFDTSKTGRLTGPTR